MENASKALLMAAGVLIGVLILSLAVYLFTTFGATSAELHQLNEENDINEFNIQFTQYEGKTDVTIYDIITVAGLARNNNEYYGYNDDTDSKSQNNFYITVNFVGRENNLQRADKKDRLTELLSEEALTTNADESYHTISGNSATDTTNRLPTYRCETTINTVTGRVYRVNFYQK